MCNLIHFSLQKILYTKLLFYLFITPFVLSSEIPTCDVPSHKLKNAANHPRKISGATARLTVTENARLWSKGIVHFTLDDSLSPEQMRLVYEAFSEFHLKTCIRFKPWDNQTSDYLTIKNEPSACSLSEVCMKGGQQFIQIGGLCWFREMIIHQLGHALCLGHEHQRPNRDDYLSYSPLCSEKDIPQTNPKDNDIGFYDYASQMHFACGWCSGGWPTQDNATKCGYQVTKGLSLLDADYINLLYRCGGCKRHRWLPVSNLQDGHKEWMHSFRYKDRLGYNLYPCRVSHQGEIIIGKFTWASKTCSFSLGGLEYYQTGDGAEVLLLPGGPKGRDGMTEYKVEPVSGYDADPQKLLKIAVPAGRLPEMEEYGLGYIAYAKGLLSPSTNEKEAAIGKAWNRDGRILQAFFPLGKKEVTSYNFNILTCHHYSRYNYNF